MNRDLIRKLKDQEIHARLINWGRWLRQDDTFDRLGFPRFVPFIQAPSNSVTVADADAEHIEFVISTFAGMKGTRGPLYAFILKIEYAERPGHALPPPEVRAEHVRKRFNRRCGRSTYYSHLANARRAVMLWADERH